MSKIKDLGVKLHVVLVQPKIPGNAGTIGRSCLGYNTKLHLVGPLGFSLEEKYVKRAGLDYWPYVDKAIWSDWNEFKSQAIPDIDHKFYFSTKAPNDFLTYKFSTLFENPPTPVRSIGLFFGCETAGLYELIGKEEMQNGTPVKLPMNENVQSGIRSLNLACTVSMVLWDVYKQLYLIKYPA
jgi:tRNA (cytidine/uridine-2'-O-)-methyltransferase